MIKGRVVISKAGRDKGNLFVIISVKDDKVYIADGKLHKIENPKKKNCKHLQFTNKLLCIDNISNKKLKKMIYNYECLI